MDHALPPARRPRVVRAGFSSVTTNAECSLGREAMTAPADPAPTTTTRVMALESWKRDAGSPARCAESP